MGMIRTLLALTVVFAHSPWHDSHVFVGGRNAVQLFYMISGFLIYYVINNNVAYKNPFKFYASRALRIYPIYLIVALLTLLISACGLNKEVFETFINAPASAGALLLFSNLLILGQDWIMFLGTRDETLVFVENFRESDLLLYKGLLIPQAWTLGLELAFYVVAPFILRRPIAIFLLLAGSLTVRAILLSQGLAFNDPWTYRFFPAELSLFLLGALSCRYLLPIWKNIVSVEGRKRAPDIITLILISVILSYFIIPINEIFKTGLLFSVFIIFIPLTFLYQNSSSLDKAIGDLSYPIYIGHILVILVSGPFFGLLMPHVGSLTVSLSNVCLSCAFAYLLNKLISFKIERLRKKFKTSTTTVAE